MTTPKVVILNQNDNCLNSRIESPFQTRCFAALRWLAYLSLVVPWCLASAQQPYALVHYDENTLPQTSIGNIQQDMKGFLWMNTQYGIVRFDGEKVRVFTTDNLKGLTSNRIRLCAKNFNGDIYFVDENYTIIKVKSPNQFETVSRNKAIEEGRLPLYTASSNSDIAFPPIDKKSGYQRFTSTLKFDQKREFLKLYSTGNNKGFLFYADQQQNTTICYYDGRQYSVHVENPEFKSQHTFKLGNSVFYQSSHSEAFILHNTGVKRAVRIKGLPVLLNRFFQEESRILFSNETGTFLYFNGNLYKYEQAGDTIVASLLFDNLPCTGVANVMRERNSGDYFISTENSGFYRIKKKQFRVVNLKDSMGVVPTQNDNNNNSNIVYALTLWDKGHLFCNEYITPTDGSGLSRPFDPNNKARFNHYFLHPKDSTHLWLNFTDGIFSLDKTTGHYTKLVTIFDPKKAIELSNGITLIVTSHDIASLQNGVVTELYHNDSIDFTAAEKISDSCLLIGYSKGLFHFYPARKKLDTVPYKEALKVRYLFKDRANRFWFTTYGQGMFYLSGKTIIPMPVDKAGYLSIGHSIAEDRGGNFWVPTNHGLFKIRYASLMSIVEGKSSKLYYTYFDKTDGFNTNEFNGGCSPAVIDQPATGKLFFPSMEGIVTFSPDSIKSTSGKSELFFDEVVLNDTSTIQVPTGELLFPNNTRSIRLFFSSPYYGHSQNITYSFSISNEQGQWQDLGNNRSVVLNNLSGGRYTITVKKEEADSVPLLTSTAFEIQKKFTETVLFKLLVLLGVTGLVFLYFKARLLFLQNERSRLEKEVALRTADQARLIDELKNTVVELRQVQQELSGMMEHRERIVSVLIHDIKSPLRFLNTVAAHLSSSLAQSEAIKNKDIAREIAASLNGLYLFVQDFAVWLASAAPGRVLVQEKIDLQKIITETVAVYVDGATRKGIAIQLPHSSPSICGDAAMIKAIVRNLLDNALKNTDNGNIQVSTGRSLAGKDCELVITDVGKGLEKEEVAELNRYFLSEQETLSFAADRSGHKIIKDFLKKMGGSIRYSPNHPNGLIAIVTLPMA